MEREQAIQTIRAIFTDCCLTKFDSLQCGILPADNITSIDCAEMPTACIDAGADGYELLLVLRLPFAVLSLTYPEQQNIFSVDDSLLEDWLGELSNRLLGELKAALLRHNSKIRVGLPRYYFGDDANPLLEEYELYSLYFEAEGVNFEASLGLTLMTDVIQLDAAETIADDSAASGELDFF